MILQLPKSVPLLDYFSLAHQEVELLEVAEVFVVAPGFLDLDGGHAWSSGAKVLLLWVLDNVIDLLLVGEERDELFFGVAILVQLSQSQEFFGRNVGEFEDVLREEPFELRYELGDGAPSGDVLPFESREFLAFLLHHAPLYEEAGIVGQISLTGLSCRSALNVRI